MKKIGILGMVFVLYFSLSSGYASAIEKYKWGKLTVTDDRKTLGKIKINRNIQVYKKKKNKLVKSSNVFKRGTEYEFLNSLDKVENNKKVTYWVLRNGNYIKNSSKDITVYWLSDKIRYNNAEKGLLKGNITYQYNAFIGSRGDVAAGVIAFPIPNVGYYTQWYLLEKMRSNQPLGELSFYTTLVDGYGNYEMKLPAGKYLVLYKSEKITRNFSEELSDFTINKLKKHILYFPKEDDLNLTLYQHKVIEVIIKPNSTVIYSIDWGYTYI